MDADKTDADTDTDSDADADADVDADSDADTDTTTTTPTTFPTVTAASCTLAVDNPLRAACSATLFEAGAVTAVFTAVDRPTRTFIVAGPAVDHAFVAWGLHPDTVWDWDIGGITGSITTGPLPPLLAGATITTTGTAFGFDVVLQALECTNQMYFVMIDPDGTIVWYEPEDDYVSRRDGYEWSEADQSLLSFGSGRFSERHVSGEPRLSLVYGVDYTSPLHHDTTRWGAYTYLLFEYRLNGRNVDGIDVFDGTTRLGTVLLGDHYAVAPGSGDWSHANGLNATANGELVLSLLTFDTVLGIDGDPASPTFLDILWSAQGRPVGGLTASTTYVAAAGPDEGFDAQHNASMVGDALWMFDNRGGGATSRAARYLVDDLSGTYQLDAAWHVDRVCPIQGGAVPIDGGVLVTCSDSAVISAFREGVATADFTLSADCGEDPWDALTRGIPVQIH